MPKTITFSSVVVVVLVLLLAAPLLTEGYYGARTEIKDVEANEEVQVLGRFSVHEYNRRSRGSAREVEFGAVVAADRQVVSGTKYYLTISGFENGEKKLYESVVVVKPWIGSKKLLHFSPSTTFILNNL